MRAALGTPTPAATAATSASTRAAAVTLAAAATAATVRAVVWSTSFWGSAFLEVSRQYLWCDGSEGDLVTQVVLDLRQ